MAKSRFAALQASKIIRVKYENVMKPKLDIKTAVEALQLNYASINHVVDFAMPCRGINKEMANKILHNLKKCSIKADIHPLEPEKLNLQIVKGEFVTR